METARKLWIAAGENEALVEKVEAEKLRQVRDGSAKRELAAKHMVRGVDTLNTIASDANANNRHRVDAIKTLHAIATPPAQAAAADRDRFIIKINLGTDTDDREIVHQFNKSRSPVVDDPNDPDNIRKSRSINVDDRDDVSAIASIAANKQGNDDGAQNHI